MPDIIDRLLDGFKSFSDDKYCKDPNKAMKKLVEDGQDRLEGHHVVVGEAVLDAVGAAGVLGDVAADRAHRPGVGIGRIEQPVGLHRLI